MACFWHLAKLLSVTNFRLIWFRFLFSKKCIYLNIMISYDKKLEFKNKYLAGSLISISSLLFFSYFSEVFASGSWSKSKIKMRISRRKSCPTNQMVHRWPRITRSVIIFYFFRDCLFIYFLLCQIHIFCILFKGVNRPTKQNSMMIGNGMLSPTLKYLFAK